MVFEYVVEGYPETSYYLMADTLKEFYERLLKQFNLKPDDVGSWGKLPQSNVKIFEGNQIGPSI